MRHGNRPLSLPSLTRRLISQGCLAFLIAGCASLPLPVTSIHQDGRSTVFLETVRDRSFQAAHPLKLDEATIANVLRGVHTREKTGLVLLLGKALMSTNLSDVRAFLDDDIALLAPHLASALSQATPNQRVGFRLYYTPELSAYSSKGENGREVTAGYLAADGLSLNVTLTHYRYRPGKVDKSQQAPYQLPDPDGLRNREVRFIPEKAVRRESGILPGWLGGADERTIAVDYHLLNKLLTSSPARPPASQPVGATGTQPAPAVNDAELRIIREELKAMQQKLAEQNAELERLKKAAGKE